MAKTETVQKGSRYFTAADHQRLDARARASEQCGDLRRYFTALTTEIAKQDNRYLVTEIMRERERVWRACGQMPR